MAIDADAIIVGGGLAGLVAAAELADAGKRVILLEQEGENSLGGQAFWSLGGLFFVDSPEQRRMRIRDSRELALQDWLGSAQFDRPEDYWPRQGRRSFHRFCGRRNAAVASCARHALVSGRRLGGTRRRAGAWAWQFGAAVSMSPGGLDPASLSLSSGACAGMLRGADRAEIPAPGKPSDQDRRPHVPGSEARFLNPPP